MNYAAPSSTSSTTTTCTLRGEPNKKANTRAQLPVIGSLLEWCVQDARSGQSNPCSEPAASPPRAVLDRGHAAQAKRCRLARRSTIDDGDDDGRFLSGSTGKFTGTMSRTVGCRTSDVALRTLPIFGISCDLHHRRQSREACVLCMPRCCSVVLRCNCNCTAIQNLCVLRWRRRPGHAYVLEYSSTADRPACLML